MNKINEVDMKTKVCQLTFSYIKEYKFMPVCRMVLKKDMCVFVGISFDEFAQSIYNSVKKEETITVKGDMFSHVFYDADFTPHQCDFVMVKSVTKENGEEIYQNEQRATPTPKEWYEMLLNNEYIPVTEEIYGLLIDETVKMNCCS